MKKGTSKYQRKGSRYCEFLVCVKPSTLEMLNKLVVIRGLSSRNELVRMALDDFTEAEGKKYGITD